MYLLKNVYLDNLSHDLVINGSQSFYNKIDSQVLPFFAQLPYPVEDPLISPNENEVRTFLSNSQSEQDKKQAQREYSRMKNDISGQNFKNSAVLPNFFLDYVESGADTIYDYGFNVSYSKGVLEQFDNQGNICLIRPGFNQDLTIYNPKTPHEKITLKWLSTDPIIDIKNMKFSHSNSFIVRGPNSIYLMDLDSEFQMKVNIKLDCNIGYHDTAFNHLTKCQLALMDTRNKLKIFDLESRTVSSSYSMNELNFELKPRLVKIDYLTQNMLMIMSDKEIKVLDNRCKEIPRKIDIELEDCDMLLNFTLDKSNISSAVHLASKHCYFTYDIRSTNVEDFMYHNLRAPPCYINHYQENGMELVTLFSQTQKEQALFGLQSPYTLPYHFKNIQETFDKCLSRKNVPIIPNLEKRINYPITGVQIVPKNQGASIYYCNIFGELFLHEASLQPSYSEDPIDRLHDWLLQISAQDDPILNVVHIANASAAFELDTDDANADVINPYEKSRVHEFLEDENFDFTNWGAEAFLEIWNEDEDSRDEILADSEPSNLRVENWIRHSEFQFDDDL